MNTPQHMDVELCCFTMSQLLNRLENVEYIQVCVCVCALENVHVKNDLTVCYSSQHIDT